MKTRIWHFGWLRMAWHQQQTCIVTLMQLPHVVLLRESATCSVRYQRYWIECIGMCHFFMFHLKVPRVSIVTLYINGILCMFNNSLLASRKICDRSPDTNLSNKPKCQKGVTQSVVSCQLESYRKSASFVWITITKTKRNMVLNFE